MTEISPNSIQGLASGLDTKSIIDKLIAAEQKRVDPIKKREKEKSLELETWKQVKITLDKTKGLAATLAKKSLWEGKLVTSSNPEVIEATATSGAKPGKHTLVVDKLALAHQIASQGFEAKDTQIGQGTVEIMIGEDPPEKIVIDETNNTVQGFADAIKALDVSVDANIIKTGNKDKPYQIVLTSKLTGEIGKITVTADLKGEKGTDSPTFDPYYSQPGKWKGLAKSNEQKAKLTGTGASTAIPELIGTYTGKEPLELNFTVVNTGVVGETESLKIRWDDNQDRYGYLDLGSFNYTPGEPIDVVDGIQLVMTDGEVIVNDNFSAKAKAQESELYWWKDKADRAPRIEQPTAWGRQATEGGPIITGDYKGDEDDVFTLKIVGSGQVGSGDVKIEVSSEKGYKGTVFIGDGYTPGSKLSLGKGLEVELKPGILTDGAYATFEYQAESTANYWWLDKADQVEGGQIKDLTNWINPEPKDKEKGKMGGLGAAASKAKGPRVSNVEKQIVGRYDSYESKVYTFTAMGSGSIGVTKNLELKWEDNQGNSGTLKVGGDEYHNGDPLEFDSSLSLVLGKGSMFEGDSFTFRTFSPVIQPPQDAEVRLGATEQGGGLLISNSTNELNDVIDGVKLNLLTVDKKPVTISIRGDTEKAKAGVIEFVNGYNEMLTFFNESIKYDKDSKKSGPLQGDRNLPRIQSEMNRLFIDPVVGLDTSTNLLMGIGLKLNKEGLIDVDEEKLNSAVADNLLQVANLFRSWGQIENAGISYLSSTHKTKISGSDGFKIDITAAASKGFYTTKRLSGPLVVDGNNNKIFISINGRESDEIDLDTGTYTAESLGKMLQQKIASDKSLSKLKVIVSVSKGQITIRSNLTGSRSVVSLRPKELDAQKAHFLVGGVSQAGTNVKGKINGIELKGNGQILGGTDGTDFEGLKLYVSLTDSQVSKGIEGTMIFTKGVGTKVQEYINNLLDPETGALGIYTKNVEEQFKGYEKEVKTLEARVDAKKKKLIEKFARLEAKMGQLKSEKNYLSQQLSKL